MCDGGLSRLQQSMLMAAPSANRSSVPKTTAVAMPTTWIPLIPADAVCKGITVNAFKGALIEVVTVITLVKMLVPADVVVTHVVVVVMGRISVAASVVSQTGPSIGALDELGKKDMVWVHTAAVMLPEDEEVKDERVAEAFMGIVAAAA